MNFNNRFYLAQYFNTFSFQHVIDIKKITNKVFYEFSMNAEALKTGVYFTHHFSIGSSQIPKAQESHVAGGSRIGQCVVLKHVIQCHLVSYPQSQVSELPIVREPDGKRLVQWDRERIRGIQAPLFLLP